MYICTVCVYIYIYMYIHMSIYIYIYICIPQEGKVLGHAGRKAQELLIACML